MKEKHYKAAASLGIKDQLLYNWKAKFEAQKSGAVLDADERAELKCPEKVA